MPLPLSETGNHFDLKVKTTITLMLAHLGLKFTKKNAPIAIDDESQPPLSSSRDAHRHHPQLRIKEVGDAKLRNFVFLLLSRLDHMVAQVHRLSIHPGRPAQNICQLYQDLCTYQAISHVSDVRRFLE